MGDANVFNIVFVGGFMLGCGYNSHTRTAFIGLGILVFEWNVGQGKTNLNQWVGVCNDRD